MKPIILITPSILDDEKVLRIGRAYTESVEKAGGIAIMADMRELDNIPRLLDIADGILLSGGVDVDPFYFGENQIKEIGEICPMRDKFEIELTQQAAKADKPLLGICRGMQIMNVAFGGKLFQDIYSRSDNKVFKHSQEMPKYYAAHSVTISENSIIKGIVGSSLIRVNTFHHQAVSVPGEKVVVTATAEDGIIEAIEYSGMRFCLGVQWHPEHMINDSKVQFNIFKEFIRVC